MLLAENNQKVSLKWFKKISVLKGKAFLPPCPPTAPLRLRMAINPWQIVKPWEAFSELLYWLAFEIKKAKPMRLRKMNSIKMESLLEDVTVGRLSTLAQWCHHNPHVLLFPLFHLGRVDFLLRPGLSSGFCFVLCFGEPQADMITALTKQTVLICLLSTVKSFFFNYQQHQNSFQVRHWHVDQDHQTPYQLYFVVVYRK